MKKSTQAMKKSAQAIEEFGRTLKEYGRAIEEYGWSITGNHCNKIIRLSLKKSGVNASSGVNRSIGNLPI